MGKRLSVILRPNHEILDTNEPEYDECYELPFTFSDGEYFAGMTRPAHLLQSEDGRQRTVSFSYSNSMEYYSIVFPDEIHGDGKLISVKFMSSRQYRKVNFVGREPGELSLSVSMEESGPKRSSNDLSQSIREGRKQYLVIKLNAFRVWSVPVDITYDYGGDSQFEFRTECFTTASHIVSPGAYRDALIASDPKIEESLAQPSFGFLQTVPLTLTYLKVLDDGTFFTVAEDAQNKMSQYEWLKVFSYP